MMLVLSKPGVVDLGVFAIANLYNLLMIGIFLSRTRGLKALESGLGLAAVALALPLGVAVILNALEKRAWWTVALPVPLILFLGAELVLDYLLRVDFRHSALLGPYLGLYYVALFAMIGYAFAVGRSYGFVTLATYFLNLLATWYSYARVGHG